MDLGDRRGGDRLAEAFVQGIDPGAERRLDDGDGLLPAHRRDAILQALELERDFGADDVGSGRQELAHLNIGRAKPVDCARETSEALDIAFGDQIGESERQAGDRGQKHRVDADERPLTGKDEARAREPQTMAERAEDAHQSELPARMDGHDPRA